MGGDVAFAHGLRDLVGSSGAVARGIDAGDVRRLFPVDDNVRTVRGKAGHQGPGRDRIPQDEEPVDGDLRPVMEHDLSDLHAALHRPHRCDLLHVRQFHAAVRIAGGKIDLLRDPGEIFHLVLVARRAAEDRDRLPLVQEAVAGRAVADAPAEQFVFPFVALRRENAGRKKEGLRLVYLVFRQDHEVPVRRHHVRDLLIHGFEAHFLCVRVKARVQFRAGDESQARIVGDLFALFHLVAVVARAEPEEVLLMQFQIDGGRQARRPAPDDDGIVHLRLLSRC